MSANDVIIPCPACDAPNTLANGQDAKSAQCTRCSAPLFTAHPMNMTAQRFNAHVVDNALPLVIDFWAEWCGPCKSMAPIFERLAGEFEPHLRFAKVDTDAEDELGQYFRIQTIPTLCVIHNRREIARISGLMSIADLRRWLYGALSGSEEVPVTH